jgi:23S rRNA (uracil1939-C5)-methyltransferase
MAGMKRAKRKSEARSLDVEAMAPSGEGLASSEGKPVLIAGALVGERVVARVESNKRARGRIEEVVRAHPERVAPPCPVAHRCGGCDWMHAAPGLQQRMHLDVVRSLLSRHAIEVPVTIAAVGEPLGYRDRARLSLRARGRQVQVGYRVSRGKSLVALEACPVLRPSLQRVFADLGAALAGSDGEGEALVGRGDGDRPVVELSFRGELAATVFGALAALAGDGWAGARLWAEGASQPASYGDPRGVTVAADGEVLRLAPGGFAQPSEAAAIALGQHVGAATAGAETIVELFAGSGTLTVMAARGVRSYVAIEQSAAAVEALRENLSARGLVARCVVGDANAQHIGPVDLVLLDPPRIGALGAVERILEARPRCVVYVSCNPATLARDLAALGARYRTEGVALFDAFPQTSHVEAVAILQRR